MKKNVNNGKKRDNKRLTNAALCSILSAAMLAGCAGASTPNSTESAQAPAGSYEAQSATSESAQAPANNAPADSAPSQSLITSDFNKALAEFIEAAGYENENYMVSPTSFQAAMILAVAGADGETKEQLIHSMGFKDMDEYNAWYSKTTELKTSFDEDIALDVEEFEANKEWFPDDKAPEGSLLMLNSIWNNTDLSGEFGKDYLKAVQKDYNAEANNVTAKEMTEKVNDFVSKGTNGLIPQIAADLSKANAVLVNTLYLKSGWINSFNDYQTAKGQFTTASGDKTDKEFMEQQESFWYYEDDDSKLVSLPLNGGLEMLLVLGDNEDYLTARSNATFEAVHVKMPKFDVESSFTQNEFIDFLKEQGADLAFDGNADFSVMCPDTSWYISNIIQKTRIKVDEEGLEAAAATALMMTECAFEGPIEPKEFIADEPFKFYIVGGADHDMVLFSGQIAQ